VAGSEENTEKRKKELRKRNNLKWGVPILFPFTRTVVEAIGNLLGAARVCWRRRREFLIEILGKRENINYESLY
jgi:hypothetical protein